MENLYKPSFFSFIETSFLVWQSGKLTKCLGAKIPSKNFSFVWFRLVEVETMERAIELNILFTIKFVESSLKKVCISNFETRPQRHAHRPFAQSELNLWHRWIHRLTQTFKIFVCLYVGTPLALSVYGNAADLSVCLWEHPCGCLSVCGNTNGFVCLFIGKSIASSVCLRERHWLGLSVGTWLALSVCSLESPLLCLSVCGSAIGLVCLGARPLTCLSVCRIIIVFACLFVGTPLALYVCWNVTGFVCLWERCWLVCLSMGTSLSLSVCLWEHQWLCLFVHWKVHCFVCLFAGTPLAWSVWG